MITSLSLPIVEQSQVGEARRKAAVLAAKLGLDELQRGELAIIVTEAASNLVLHASGGELLLNAYQHGNETGIDMLALDRGPGIENIEAALRDGYSTAGTAGTGLGAISRLASVFSIYSTVPSSLPTAAGSTVVGGSVLFARVRRHGSDPAPTAPAAGQAIAIGAINAPKSGEEICGDIWAVRLQDRNLTVLLCDGLGHGPFAAQAGKAAAQIFAATEWQDSSSFIGDCDNALRGTRGAALAVADIDLGLRTLRYAGIGNIAASVRSPGGNFSMVSLSGIVGAGVRKVQEFSYTVPAQSLLIMHSDGLNNHWDLARYPGLSQKHPAVVAGVLYRDFSRQRDDATVVALALP